MTILNKVIIIIRKSQLLFSDNTLILLSGMRLSELKFIYTPSTSFCRNLAYVRWTALISETYCSCNLMWAWYTISGRSDWTPRLRCWWTVTVPFWILRWNVVFTTAVPFRGSFTEVPGSLLSPFADTIRNPASQGIWTCDHICIRHAPPPTAGE